jgi:hypothetical protein
MTNTHTVNLYGAQVHYTDTGSILSLVKSVDTDNYTGPVLDKTKIKGESDAILFIRFKR